jgi:hypothetical protein
MSSIVISGDTSGAITLAAPAVSGTNTATLPAATGTVMVSGNMPAFSASPSATTTLSASTYTKITYGTKLFDTNNMYDATNSKFQPTIAGYYQINAGFGEGISTANMTLYILLKKSGTTIAQAQTVQPTAWYDNVQVSMLIYMNGTTDYIEVYGFAGSAYTNQTNAYTNWFNGAMVRAA